MIRDIVALFGAGVASFLAPCVVPLLPAYLGVIAGDAGTRDEGGPACVARTPWPATSVRATAIFVLGFAVIFATLGALAGLVGSSLDGVQELLQRAGGVLIVIMGLAMLGVLRGPLARERRLLSGPLPGSGPLRPFVVGVAFGAAWTPCVGPLLGAALTVAAANGGVVRGAVLLLAYALGIGVPFLLASLGLASSPGAAAWLRRVSRPIQIVGGVVLVALGLLLLTGWYAHLTSYLARFTPKVAGL